MLFVILDLHSACIYGGGLSILKILVSELTRISEFVRLKGLEPHAVKHQILSLTWLPITPQPHWNRVQR